MAIDTPRQIALNADHDLVIGANLTVLAGRAAIAQACDTALRLFQGEWFLDLTAGIPYFQSVLVKNPDASVLTSVFRKCLLGVLGVTDVASLSFQLVSASRQLQVTYQVDTDYGLLTPQTVTLSPGVGT